MSTEKEKLIHTTTGATSSGPGCVIGVLGGTVAITMLILSTVLSDKVGPWWLWALIILAFAGWTILDIKRSKTIIELYKSDNDFLRLSVKGPGQEVKMKFSAAGTSNWYAHEQMRAKHGGDVLVVYFCVIADAENNNVGSSRVDLQACKLEYSIVSPK